MSKTAIATSPTFEIDLGEQIICFDSSSSIIHSENIILLGFKRRIVILAIDNSSTNDGETSFNYKKIRDIPDSDSVRILKLCSSIIVRDILFASATNFDVKIYNANESESTCLKTITAHDNYINTMDFTEDFLATGSDDHTCKIFSVRDDYEENIVLNFSSSVTCVKFNSEEPYKLIIGTKNGSMFVYCLRLRQSLFSFQTQSPLMSFDWSTKNPCFVACLVADQIIYYDISKPDIPIYSKRVSDVGKMIKMHPQNPLVSVVACSRAGTDIEVIHQKSSFPLFTTKIIIFTNNISWNGSFLVTGSDRKICFYKISVPVV